jgi:putative ABC transport system permease protein
MYSLIKIGGFALGIAACLLIALFIRDELGYDRQFQDGDRIYRVVEVYNNNGNLGKSPVLPAPFANALKEDFPEVEKVGRFLRSELFGAGGNEIRRTDKEQNTYEDGFVFADQGFLNVFQPLMVHGDLAHALDEPGTIVLSRLMADKYFPNDDPIGKTLIINDKETNPYRITGVMDFPAKSHFQSDFLISLKGVEFWNGEQKEWNSYNYHTYVVLRPGTDVIQMEAKLSAITKKYLTAGNADAEKKISFTLQPVSDIHLKSDGIRDGLIHGDIRFVWLFGIIAGFILLIACINFINLSTAKSANKTKEVGLRKAVGSNRSNLVGQFLTESLLYSFLSFVLGILLAALLLPYFNMLSAKSLVIPLTEWRRVLPLLVFASVIVGILAGLYPAFYLSSFKPVSTLKGRMSRESKSYNMRSALVVFQFTVSIILISGTFIIYRQVDYILNKNVGFDKEQVLLLQGANTLGNQVTTFKNELLRLPKVKNVSISDYLPVAGTKRNGNLFRNEGNIGDGGFSAGQFWQVDRDYIKTMGMNIVQGRDFAANMPTDSKAAIINQTMAKELGLTDPIDKRITNGGGNVLTIVGVVEDFHFESLKENIRGVCLALGNSPNIVSVKVSASDMSAAIKSINGVWNKFSVNQPIRYSFLDESFTKMYSDVQRMARIFSAFALLAIVVACLGLFALSSFMIEQRTKEIGIRKVNGARSIEVTISLNNDFLIWVAIAFVIATPVAWFGMHKWLENFAYKTELSWWIFTLSGALALGIALLTVSWQSWKAATRNPVEALRYE